MSGRNRLFQDAGVVTESDIDVIKNNCSCNIQGESYSLVLSFVSARTVLQLRISGLSLLARLNRDYYHTNWSKWYNITAFSE